LLDLIKSLLKEIFPPALIRLFSTCLNKRYGFRGDYSSWEEARAASDGYDAEGILPKVKDALLKVKVGQAIYERDSVIFKEIHYSWPLLAGLMWVAAQQGGNLNLLDFGGSLGSTYFQNRKFLLALPNVSWSIVEQDRFVDEGKKQFENETLRFYKNLDSCIRETNPHCILFSSVLQYLESPYALLQQVKALSLPFILIDRTGFIESGKDRLTVQKVHPAIYRASYPCWFFDRQKFLFFLDDRYDLIAEFDALAGTMRLDCGQVATDKGFIFRRRRHS
jgi:putative methyltransferase (TIGR04325 family)